MSKNDKENPTDQQPQEECEDHGEQQIMTDIPHEGYGKFKYLNGTVYEGQWKLINGKKVREGEGVLIHGGNLADGLGNEEYRGSWKNDMMHGYGVYKYTSGAIYSGDWECGMHNGIGQYRFPSGCTYEGEWLNHKMHGQGTFTDDSGKKWKDKFFVHGVFQSKMQKKLKLEKMEKEKKQAILIRALKFFESFDNVYKFCKGKNYRQNLSQFFATEEIKDHVRGPYAQYDYLHHSEWVEALKFLSKYDNANVLSHFTDAKLIDSQRIMTSQFSGPGQIVEFTRKTEDHISEICLINLVEGQWTIVHFKDEDKNRKPRKKKKGKRRGKK